MSVRPQDDVRRGRRSIAIITAGFIAISAALHLVLGGAFPTVHFSSSPTPSVGRIDIATLETPPPPSPTPRPSPTPQPTQRPKAMRSASPAPHVHMHAPHEAIAPPRVVAASTAPEGPPHPKGPAANAPPAEASPEPSSPADDRYVIVSARFDHEVRPEYPRDAIEQGEQGTVIVLVTVGPEGPSDFRVWVSSGYPSLDRAALSAAQESTFSVPEHNGQPVTETYRIIYTFSLDT